MFKKDGKRYRVKSLEWKKNHLGNICAGMSDCHFVIKEDVSFEVYINYPYGTLDLNLVDEKFNSLADAKAYCQKHLEEKIMALLEEVRDEDFKIDITLKPRKTCFERCPQCDEKEVDFSYCKGGKSNPSECAGLEEPHYHVGCPASGCAYRWFTLTK